MAIRTPRISGYPLASLAQLARSRVGSLVMKPILRGQMRVDQLARLPDAMRGPLPLDNRALQARPPRAREDAGLPPPSGTAWAGSSDTYAAAYRAGSVTPSEVVRLALDRARSLARCTPPVGPLNEYTEAAALAEAEEATARWRSGKARGPLDGVPCAVKETTGVEGLPRLAGANFVDRTPCGADATCVARLRAAGAIILGSASMTELGMSPLGFNPSRSMPRNPHATDRAAGGSSTGAAVGVATGLFPFALAVDGGGSIRIPAALNGVFGIKPTWGRISRAGDTSSGSLQHVGALAGSTLDLARTIEWVAGPDPEDRQTAQTPPIARGSLESALGRGVRGLRIAVEEEEWRDADPAIARAGEQSLRALEKAGATVTRVRLPVARHAAAIGYVILGAETRAALNGEWRDHADEMTHTVQVTFAALEELCAVDYIDALRLRAGLRRALAELLLDVDLIALPTTAGTAVRVTDAEMASGFVDAKAMNDFCRFTFLASLAGLPAATAPVGKDADGLPMGFQLVGDAFDEGSVLAAMAHLERVGVARAERPGVSAAPELSTNRSW